MKIDLLLAKLSLKLNMNRILKIDLLDAFSWYLKEHKRTWRNLKDHRLTNRNTWGILRNQDEPGWTWINLYELGWTWLNLNEPGWTWIISQKEPNLEGTWRNLNKIKGTLREMKEYGLMDIKGTLKISKEPEGTWMDLKEP